MQVYSLKKARMRLALVGGLVLALAALFLALDAAVLAAQPTGASKISTKVMLESANGQIAPVVVTIAEKADVSAAYKITNSADRATFVYKTLTEHAAKTQAGLKALLDARRKIRFALDF